MGQGLSTPGPKANSGAANSQQKNATGTITNMLSAVKSTNKATNGLLSGMLQSMAPLEKSGPYNQVESAGMLGKAYSIPTVNPDDGSYMPECAQGNCLRYDTAVRNDGTRECLVYGEPHTIQASTLFDTKERHSCGYDLTPVALMSSDKPSYYVYWQAGKKPKTGGSKKRKSPRKNKTRRSKKGE
jgi:hypothetical protein